MFLQLSKIETEAVSMYSIQNINPPRWTISIKQKFCYLMQTMMMVYCGVCHYQAEEHRSQWKGGVWCNKYNKAMHSFSNGFKILVFKLVWWNVQLWCHRVVHNVNSRFILQGNEPLVQILYSHGGCYWAQGLIGKFRCKNVVLFCGGFLPSGATMGFPVCRRYTLRTIIHTMLLT